jgi:hypothetical protein
MLVGVENVGSTWRSSMDAYLSASTSELEVWVDSMFSAREEEFDILLSRLCGSRRASLKASDVPCVEGSYLVDPASSHMLVSKIKPCMSKYELFQTVKLRMAH